jgi:hypothetical protein
MSFYSPFLPRFDDEVQKLQWKSAAILATGLGLAGNDIVESGETRTGHWWCIHALGDVVLGNIVFAPGTSTGSLAGKTLSNGDREYGNIISVTVTSGTLVCSRQAAGVP